MELRKDVIGLTDAWGVPDFIHKAPIGKYDGDIYPGKKKKSLTCLASVLALIS
jgi:hypothetical protein